MAELEGAELSAAVARDVMKYNDGNRIAASCPYFFCDRDGVWVELVEHGPPEMHKFNPHESWADAMEVVEAVLAKGERCPEFFIECDYYIESQVHIWSASFQMVPAGPVCESEGDSGPTAICRAALAAVGEGEE